MRSSVGIGAAGVVIGGCNLPQRPFGNVFPYVALPNDQAVNDAANSGANVGTPEGGVGAGLGGMAFRRDVFVPAAALVGGTLLAAGGFLMLRRKSA